MRKGSVAAAGIWLGLLVPGAAQAQPRFITVNQGPDELAADRSLAERLGGSLVARPEEEEYKVVIDDLVADRVTGGTVARVTPYAFVVAEMLGAKLDLIATFRSRASGTTTYGAYLVVRRSEFPPGSAPTLSQVMDYLQRRSENGSPAKFVYHDRFSTSSYFFPSLYFRGQKVFAQTGDPDKDTSTISVERLPGSSSGLVDAVADGRADVASVWDGARARFAPARDPQHAAAADKVWFVRFPGNLPDDVLVATRRAHEAGDAIRSRLEQDKGQAAYPAGSDVQAWVLWSDGDAEAARLALAELRRQAAASTVPVVVDVRPVAPRPGGPTPASPEEVEAARQAMRLAGTELVGMSGHSDYYNKSDIVWELARIHDNAIQMTVRYDHFFVDAAGKQEATQEFQISYKENDLDDLTRRVSLLVTTRMHRIRPVWLYWDTAPTVIRDMAFDTPGGMDLPFQEILWKDPQRNDYTVRDYRVAQLVSSDSNKLELARANFPERGDKTLAFEPMSRRAFRVLLLRPTRERPLFEALTVAFVALFALAAIGLVWDARKDWVRPAAPVAPDRERPPAAVMPDPHTPAFSGRA